MKKIDINEIQGILLAMGKNICNILDKNNMPYIIAFGTLLGAVRHKGFIPWDDDFDIFLFEDTYDEAIRLLKKELSKNYFVEDSESEPLYFHSWAHIKDLSTIAVCEQFPQDNIYSHKGLSVDLYKLREMDESQVDLYRLKENKEYQTRKYKVGLITEEKYMSFLQEINTKIRQEELTIRNDINGKKVFGMVLNERLIYYEDVFPLVKYRFENEFFWGPHNYDNVLSQFYGDYMSLPSIDKRIPHYSQVELID